MGKLAAIIFLKSQTIQNEEGRGMIKNVDAGIIIAALCVDGGDVLNLAWAPNTEPLVFIIFTIFFFFSLSCGTKNFM